MAIKNHDTQSETPLSYGEDLPDCASEIPDTQGLPDKRRIAIDKVGIKDIQHPVRVMDRSQGEQHTIARFNAFVGLPHHFKGTHMSRFVEILNQHEREISVLSFRNILEEMRDRLEAEEAHLEMTFPLFVMKSAPATGVQSLMDYEVTFHGNLSSDDYGIIIEVNVPVTSLCPCSKSISRYGAHNQRSNVNLKVRAEDFVWVEDLVELVESEASCDLYGVLKRPDEKYVTERAYDNPKFVEDMVRDIARRLEDDGRILWYSVGAENFESIHNHSAYAWIERDKAEPLPET
ncbi:GTP cyclohydrolase FolE2 [Thiohalorhabdus methylotrophus]|uniref:GTP cyclohydrolase FolE2 n=1 Tax=Thiohalorhabdus methylotrophus TaxID=3242694 RepID=A0ABV4TXH0_9GAMM